MHNAKEGANILGFVGGAQHGMVGRSIAGEQLEVGVEPTP